MGSQNTNIMGGTYTVTITDAVGCTEEEIYELMGGGPVEIPYFGQLSSCEGLNNGEATALPICDCTYPNFSYSWSNGGQTETISNLSPGNYCVTVTNDDSGCTAEECVEIISDTPDGNLNVEAEVSPTCPNTNQGQIQLSVDGGLPPYTYNWNTSYPGSGQIILGKPQGTYCVTITDHCETSFPECYDIEGPDELTFHNAVSNIPSCPSGVTGTGSIQINFQGGLPPFQAVLSGAGNPFFIPGFLNNTSIRVLGINYLPPGNHTVIISDACDQTLTYSFTTGTFPIITIDNPATCWTEVYCLNGSNGGFGEFQYATPLEYTYIQMPGNINGAGEYDPCVFYKVCDIPEAISNPELYGEVVNGNIVETGEITFNGIQCLKERKCESPDGEISLPYSPLMENQTMNTGVIVETYDNGSPRYCVDEILCNGVVIYTSDEYFCGHALIDDPSSAILMNTPQDKKAKIKKRPNYNEIPSRVKQDSLINIFPNPFTKEINIVFKSFENQKVELRLVNFLEQEIWRESRILDKGLNQFFINTETLLPSGIYIFEITSASGHRFSKPLIH